METKKAEIGLPPAVDFWKPLKKKEDKDDDCKLKKDECATISAPFTLDGQSTKHAPTHECHIKIFKDGSAEDHCNHPHQVDKEDCQGPVLD